MIKLLLFLVAFRTEAQTLLMIGEREAFTANTGIARVGSSSAPLYNPAGLATVEQAKISASGTVFQSTAVEVEGTTSGRSQVFQSVPTQVSTVGKWGDKRWAFSVFNPQATDYSLTLQVDAGSGPGMIPASIKATSTSLVFGPSGAMKLREKWLIGASLFIQKDDFYFNSVSRLDRTNGAASAHILSQSEIKTGTFSLVPQVGATYLHSDKWTFGARAVLPTIPLVGETKTMTQSVGWTDDGAGTITDVGVPETRDKLDAKTEGAPELSFGAKWSLSGRWRLFGDLGYSFEYKFKPYKGGDETKEDASMLASVGAEYGLSANATLAGGLLLHQNSARNEPGEVDSFKGFTLGYVSSAQQIDTGVGVSYVFGSGESGGVKSDTSSVGLILSSAYRF